MCVWALTKALPPASAAKQREIYDQVSSALQSRGDNIRGICTEFNNDHDAVEVGPNPR